jgi:hypothetical protein
MVSALAGFIPAEEFFSCENYAEALGELQAEDELVRVFAALPGDRAQMHKMVAAVIGVIPPEEFFSPENFARILARAGTPQPTAA